MSLIYTAQHAEQWAEFSGDRNPLHFDLKRAASMGLPEVAIHGMRALLDGKAALSRAAGRATFPEDAVLRFHARLRQPTLCRTPYELPIAASPEAKKWQAKCVARHTGDVTYSAALHETSALTFAEAYTPYELCYGPMFALLDKISAVTGAYPWIALDAMLFSRIVHAPETLITVHDVLPGLHATNLVDVFKQVPLVQTHHETRFSASLLYTGRVQQPASLHYCITPTLVLGDSAGGVVLRMGIQCFQQHEPLMDVAVTLKTWPVSAPVKG
ncbi:hypothetical protein CYR40_02125 [Chimaeribacter arupi]|uniref:MaoC/PaaZ C-terminal domain-containing protein n=1 Tax=Chimaeribacter arupi TaxID=2060066 RepID=UPI000C7E6C1B|nr:MaoC/PaaZ C-terminal domain-containing protein [Chimaeribacter arupi]PLR50467.1 hypothetical protein CYR40_02125 [Chimaeribacter arupi]